MPARKGNVEAENASKFTGSARLQSLQFKDKEEVFLRFLTPHTDWPVVDTHIAVPTKDKPKKWRADQQFPKAMSASCSNDVMFVPVEPEDGQPMVYEDGFGNCYIHANYTTVLDQWNNPYSGARPITHSLAVLRERKGKVIRDVMEEREVNGEKRLVPAIRVIDKPWKSFFSQVHAGAVEDEDVRTKDWAVVKDGRDWKISALSITANHHPAVEDNPILGTAPATDSWVLYEEAIKFVEADLENYLRERGSEAWMKRWFWPGEWDEKDDTEADNAGTNVGGGGLDVAGLSDDQRAQMEAYIKRMKEEGASS